VTRVNRYSQTTRDANEDPLLKLAAQLGAHWIQGPPLDGWIFCRGVWMPVEIKMPEREGLKGEYTPAQLRFLRFCSDRAAPHFVWRTEEDVIASLSARRSA
jgi:hypothetical protein